MSTPSFNPSGIFRKSDLQRAIGDARGVHCKVADRLLADFLAFAQLLLHSCTSVTDTVVTLSGLKLGITLLH